MAKQNKQLLIGAGQVRPIKVNPTTEEFTKITGKKPYVPLSYSPTEKAGAITTPYHILVHNSKMDMYSMIKFNISEDIDVTSKGKVRSIDLKGNIQYLTEGVETKDFDYSYSRPLLKGEGALLSFFKTAAKIGRTTKNNNFLTDLESQGITPDTLVSGEAASIFNDIIDSHIDSNRSYSLGVMYSVMEFQNNDGTTGYGQYIETGKYSFTPFLYTINDMLSKEFINKLGKDVEKSPTMGLIRGINYFNNVEVFDLTNSKDKYVFPIKFNSKNTPKETKKDVSLPKGNTVNTYSEKSVAAFNSFPKEEEFEDDLPF